MKKILVIEDELSVRENLVELLEAEDFKVFSTDNGILAVLWTQENTPDLIICDVMMPEINGYEVLEELRQMPMTASIPFIFLTAMSDKDDLRRGMELGADDYLTKPFTREELLGAIASRLSRQEIAMQQYNAERQRAEVLQQQVRELQQQDPSKELGRELQNALLKLNTAINMLRKLDPGMQRERSVKVLQEICTEEMALLKKKPNLYNLLTPENASWLDQLATNLRRDKRNEGGKN